MDEKTAQKERELNDVLFDIFYQRLFNEITDKTTKERARLMFDISFAWGAWQCHKRYDPIFKDLRKIISD